MITLKPVSTVLPEALQQLADNPDIARYLRDAFPNPYTLAHAEVFKKLAAEGAVGHAFAIYSNNTFIGIGSVVPQQDIYRNNAEIGYWLGQPYWGKGYATDAVKLLVSYAFNNLRLHRVYAGVFAGNNASMRVLEKVGFRLEAVLKNAITKHGVLMDEHLYSIVKDESQT